MKVENTSEYVDVMHKRALGELPEMGSAKKIRDIFNKFFFLNSNDNFSILDVGAATGHYYQSFLNDPIKDYTALEIDVKMIEAGRLAWKREVEQGKIQFIQADFDFFESEQKYDLVFCSNAFMYFSSVEKSLQKLIRLSKKGLLIRSYFYDTSYRIIRPQTQENHDNSGIKEIDNIDSDGNFKSYDYWNIYSFSLVETLVKKYSKNAALHWIDNELVSKEIEAEKLMGIQKRGATEVFGNSEISYPFFLPWKYLLIRF